MENMQKYNLERCEKIYKAVEKPNWRVWKVKDTSGKVRQNRYRINSPTKLKKFIGSNAEKIYVSVGQFLQPHKLSTKKQEGPGYKYADRIMVGMDYYFDLDNESSFVTAVNEGFKLVHLANNLVTYSSVEISDSGNKGVKVLIKANLDQPEPNPLKRIESYQNTRKKLTKQIMNQINITSLDMFYENIWSDPFRVCPATYSFKKREVTPFFDCAQSSEAKANDEVVLPHKYQSKKRSRLSSYSIFRYVTNCVKGTKGNYIPVIKLRQLNRNLLKKVQYVYNLTDLEIYKAGEYYYCVSTKCVQFSRLQKILKYSNSLNAVDLVRHKFLTIPIDDIYDEKGVLKHKLEFVTTLKSKVGIHSNHSKFHSWYFGLNYPKLIGLSPQEMKGCNYSPFNIMYERVLQ